VKKIRLKPFRFEMGQAQEMLNIFKKLYPLEDKIRHVIWIAPNKILIEKTVSTKDVNEFILEEPSKVDRSLVEAFGRNYEKLNVFFVSNIERDDENNF